MQLAFLIDFVRNRISSFHLEGRFLKSEFPDVLGGV